MFFHSPHSRLNPFHSKNFQGQHPKGKKHKLLGELDVVGESVESVEFVGEGGVELPAFAYASIQITIPTMAKNSINSK
jgi:hypothetical protein